MYLGTRDGLYSWDGSGVTHVLGDGPVEVAASRGETVARTTAAVYRAAPDGWEPVDLPTDAPTGLATGDGVVHVGATDPVELLSSYDGGHSWERQPLPDLPPATRWLSGEGPTVVDSAGGRIGAVVDTGDVLAVGVERAGVFVRADGDWEKRSDGLHEDVHELLAVDETTWYATTGGGFYRTDRAGERWRHLDTGQRFQQYTYYHALAEYDGTVYTAGGAHMPGDWGEHGADCLLFRLEDDRLVEDGTPDPEEYCWCLATVAGDLYAGTVTQDLDQSGTVPGRLLRRSEGGWDPVVEAPAGITSCAGR